MSTQIANPSDGPFGPLAARLQAAELVREAEEAANAAAEQAVTPERANWKRNRGEPIAATG